MSVTLVNLEDAPFVETKKLLLARLREAIEDIESWPDDALACAIAKPARSYTLIRTHLESETDTLGFLVTVSGHTSAAIAVLHHIGAAIDPNAPGPALRPDCLPS